MAKIKFYLGEIVGKLAGLCFQRSGSGATLRANTTPVNPVLPIQTERRSFVSLISKSWSFDLSQAQRDLWNTLASATPQQDKLGQTIYLSGYNWYTRLNSNINMVGDVLIEDAPANLDCTDILSLSISDMYDQDGAVEATVSPVNEANERLICYGVANVNPGILYVADRYYFWGESTAGQASPIEYTLPANKGVFQLGQFNHLLFKRYNEDNGVMTSGFAVSGEVVASP